MTTDDSSLLLTLEEISQLVSHSHNPAETLANIVHLIRDRVRTAVCSVYLLEPERNELVLSATVGLKAEAIGRVRMRVDEGLTGLVAEYRRPIMVPDAFEHPRFKYFPDAGEDPYHSFLGVPLVESGVLQGVLVVQTAEPRMFRPSEIRMLVTVGAQLASLVADAHLLELITEATHEPARKAPQTVPSSLTLSGLPLSPGVGYGQAYVVGDPDQWRRGVCLESDNPTEQQSRLHQATERAREELTRLSQRVSLLVGDDHAAILQAQLLIMQDESLASELQLRLGEGASAEGALLATLDKYVAAFQKVTTPFFQERLYDLKDVFYRILWQLRGESGEPSASEGGAGTSPADAGGSPRTNRVVLVTREASVMELFAVDLDRLAGVVVEHGGPQSHAAILARSLGVPMVGQRTEFASLTRPGQLLLVDGTKGEVILAPPRDRLVPPSPPPRAEPIPPETPPVPGLPRIEVNINLLIEVEQARKLGVPGIGLYRSEFLFLARRTLPTEEEQVSLYRKLLSHLPGRPVTIRTFDLRPDKLASYSHLSSSASRPMDWRLVLESPPLQQLFLEQLRAILRAAKQNSVRILVPLVTRSEVLDFVIQTLANARAGLAREGLEFAPDVPLGVMIEVAAAIPMVGAWADQVSFFALGTNDLAASALGIGRDDPLAVSQGDPLHPGLLRLINDVVSIAHPMGRPVTVCGEMTADPVGALALAALQIDSLSVPVHQYLATREALSRLSADSLIRLKPQLLRQRTASEIRGLLSQWLQKN